MKKMYVSRVYHLVNPKNRLQSAAYELIKEQQGIGIDDLDAFKEHFKMRISVLNNQHPKCAPLVVSSKGQDNFLFVEFDQSQLGSIECVLITGFFGTMAL